MSEVVVVEPKGERKRKSNNGNGVKKEGVGGGGAAGTGSEQVNEKRAPGRVNAEGSAFTLCCCVMSTEGLQTTA